MNSYLTSINIFFLSRTVFEIFDFKVFRVWPWPLTFRGQLGSNIFPSFVSPYMTSYLTSIDTFFLSRTVFDIFDFKVFSVWPWPLTFRGSLVSKIFPPFESPYMTSYLTSINTFFLSRTVFEIFDFKVFNVWPWPLTFRGHLWSKIFSWFESPYMTSYLTSIDTFFPSRTVFEIFDFKVFRVWPWPLTFRGQLGSNIFPSFVSPYMTSYLTSIDTFFLSRTVFEIFDFKVFRVWPWPLTFEGHLGSKIFSPFEIPYMTSYLTSINTFFLSRTVFEIFDFKVFSVWPWPLTFKGHLGSKIFSPFESPYTFSLSRAVFKNFNFKGFRVWPWLLTFRGQLRSKKISLFESPYMTTYLISINTFFLSRTVFEIFDFKVFRVWPWPLTFRGQLGSNIFPSFVSPYMTSYLTSIDTFFLSRTVFDIFDFKDFSVWPWPLTFRGHLGSKIFSPFESPYMTSYLTSMNTFFLSRTVFEIFDFKVFSVWPWLLTFRGQLGSNIFPSFVSPYMTSYLTSIDTFFLSRTVFDIFDFKVFSVWPWPLTFRGPLGSKIFSPFESPYMTSYLTSINTFFLSRTVFEIFVFKVFSVWLWPLTFRGHLGSKIFLTIWKPIHDFLSNFYRHFLSISYLFRDIRLQSF